MFDLRHLLSENMICYLGNLRGGHKKLQVKDKRSLKTFVTTWRSYEKFSLSINILLGPLTSILIMIDPVPN